jgi:teichuronic acid biosynthesis glycosyltransferase TuaG
MTTVSVIIPAHRWDAFVAEAIISAQQQTRKPDEIILVNDGAGDSINQPVRAQFPAIKIVELKKNSGEAAARNAGVVAAQGEWIAFLDADDIWLPQKLDRQLALMQQNPDWHASYTGVTIFNQDGDVASYCNKPPVLSVTDLLVCTHALPSSLFLRRTDYLSLNGFDPSFPNATDHDFLLRFALSGHLMGLVAEPLLRFRRAGHGNISSNWWSVLKGKTRFFSRHYRIFFAYGGWRAPLRFFGHVLGECAAKTPVVWQRHTLWFVAKCLLWCAGVDWQQQLREQENLSARSEE